MVGVCSGWGWVVVVEEAAAVVFTLLLSGSFLPPMNGIAVLNHDLLPMPPVFADSSVVVWGSVRVVVAGVSVDLPPREVFLSLSESTRGSALLARSEA